MELKWHWFPLCLKKCRHGGVKFGAKLKNWFRIQRLGFRFCGQGMERTRLHVIKFLQPQYDYPFLGFADLVHRRKITCPQQSLDTSFCPEATLTRNIEEIYIFFHEEKKNIYIYNIIYFNI